MPLEDADVVVVGGGIAGRCAAYFATRRGRDVTIVDAGMHAASALPVALVNPLRGREPRLVPRGVDGMRATFGLVDALRANGHAIGGARGLHRPLLGARAQVDEAGWRARIGGHLAFDWIASASEALGLADDAPALVLREAGWLAAPSFLAALDAETAAVRIAARVASLDRRRVVLDDGTVIRARTTVWCGGAWGASLLDADAVDGRYEPGSLCVARGPLAREPLAFGTYAVPLGGGTIVGPTREESSHRFVDAPVAAAVVRQLEDRIAAAFGERISLAPVWRGVRLTRLSTAAGVALEGVDRLAAFGSRGFLLAPLRADEWARSL